MITVTIETTGVPEAAGIALASVIGFAMLAATGTWPHIYAKTGSRVRGLKEALAHRILEQCFEDPPARIVVLPDSAFDTVGAS